MNKFVCTRKFLHGRVRDAARYSFDESAFLDANAMGLVVTLICHCEERSDVAICFDLCTQSVVPARDCYTQCAHWVRNDILGLLYNKPHCTRQCGL
ncbi:MAG: hypothetical protein PUF80_04820 [Firmicutes bacterium]|nr:hypothetical protein [Bacillota bacterium]